MGINPEGYGLVRVTPERWNQVTSILNFRMDEFGFARFAFWCGPAETEMFGWSGGDGKEFWLRPDLA